MDLKSSGGPNRRRLGPHHSSYFGMKISVIVRFRPGSRSGAETHARFLPLFLNARREGSLDVYRIARDLDYSPSDKLAKYAPSPAKKIDFLEAFEFYCEKSGIKGGATGATAKRWRPKIKAFCDFIKHTDLGRMTTDQGYLWLDHLVDKGFNKKSI